MARLNTAIHMLKQYAELHPHAPKAKDIRSVLDDLAALRKERDELQKTMKEWPIMADDTLVTPALVTNCMWTADLRCLTVLEIRIMEYDVECNCVDEYGEEVIVDVAKCYPTREAAEAARAEAEKP